MMTSSKLALSGILAALLMTGATGTFAQEATQEEIQQAALAAGNVEAGETIFKKCKACHKIGDDAKNGVGPALTGIVGEEIASSEGYKYSKPFLEKKETALVWNIEALDAFLTKPKDFIPKTKMTFAGLNDAEDRANVIAYLASVSDDE